MAPLKAGNLWQSRSWWSWLTGHTQGPPGRSSAAVAVQAAAAASRRKRGRVLTLLVTLIAFLCGLRLALPAPLPSPAPLPAPASIASPAPVVVLAPALTPCRCLLLPGFVLMTPRPLHLTTSSNWYSLTWNIGLMTHNSAPPFCSTQVLLCAGVLEVPFPLRAVLPQPSKARSSKGEALQGLMQWLTCRAHAVAYLQGLMQGFSNRDRTVILFLTRPHTLVGGPLSQRCLAHEL